MPQKRFMRRGIARIYWLLTVADPVAGPTRAELTAGDDVTDNVAAVSGFTSSTTTIPTPDMGTRFEATIPGPITVADSSLRFYDDEDSEEIEELFVPETTGYVYFMRKGDKPTSATGDLFPARVSSRTPNYTVGNEPADNTVAFALTAPPSYDTVIPAAV
jgi:hypothetical protein